jgi:hypothetical protein
MILKGIYLDMNIVKTLLFVWEGKADYVVDGKRPSSQRG